MKLKKITFSLILLILVSSATYSQITETFHKTYSCFEVNVIKVNLLGNVSIEQWDGTSVMVKTKVSLTNASKAALEHFITKKGRYDIVDNNLNNALSLESKDTKRSPIILKNGSCDETVDVIVYIPVTYQEQDDGTYLSTEDIYIAGEEEDN